MWRSVLSVVLHFWANALLRFRETCLRYAMLVASTRRGLFAHARVFLHIINNRCLMIPLLPMSLEKVPIPIPMTRGTSFNDCKIVPHVFIALSTFLWRTQQQISKANFWGLTSAPLAYGGRSFILYFTSSPRNNVDVRGRGVGTLSTCSCSQKYDMHN